MANIGYLSNKVLRIIIYTQLFDNLFLYLSTLKQGGEGVAPIFFVSDIIIYSSHVQQQKKQTLSISLSRLSIALN